MPESFPQPTQENQPIQTQGQSKGVSWGKIIITVLIIAAVLAVLIGIYWLLVLNKEDVKVGPIKVSTQSSKQATSSSESKTEDQTDANKVVKEEVSEALKQQQKVSVIINLTAPQPPQDGNEFDEYKNEIKVIQDSVLALLAPEDFELGYQWEALPGLSGRISKKGLEAIKDSKDVVSVVLDKAVKIEPGM